MSKNRELKKIIGKIWGKQYGKISSQEMATLKKIQRGYDQSLFHVSAEKIAYKISRQREQTILQEFGEKGIRNEWDPQILVFAKDIAVDPNFTSDVLLYLARDCLLEDIDDPVANEDRINIIKRLDRQSKHESLTLAQRYAERCFTGIELIVFYKNLLELWQDDIKEVLRIIFFNQDAGDQLLRKEFVNREPFVDPNGVKHKQPDQPIVGRYTPNDEIKKFIGESTELYTARLIMIFMYSAYFPLYKQDWLTEEAKKWIKEKLQFKRWFVQENLDLVYEEVDIAKQLITLKVYWDGLITRLRKTYYQKKDFRGLGTETQRILDEIKNNPKTNVVFTPELLKSKITQNINLGIYYYFDQTYKMKTSETSLIYQENKESFQSIFDEYWSNSEFELFYKSMWNLWSKLRAQHSDKKKEELFVEWEYAQEQRRFIESFDTIQKKHFSKISSIMRESSPETGIELLDRAIALITLELSEIALSGIDIGHFQKKIFEDSLIQQLTSQIKFLLPLKDKFIKDSIDSIDKELIRPAFDTELEKAVGITIFNYLNDWFSTIKDVFKTRDRFLREKLCTSEKYQLFLEIYERYVRTGIEMLKHFDKSEQVNVLENLQILNILDFAKYVVLASNTKINLQEAYDKAAKYFETDPVKLDGQSKYFDVTVLLKLVEDNLVEDVAKTETSSELRGIINLVDSNLDYTNKLQLKDCEKIIRSFLEKQNVRHNQKYITQFRDKVYEWNAGRYIEKSLFVEWLSKLDTTKTNVDNVTQIKKEAENEIAIVYLDITGERKGVGKESNKALDAGLFQAIRPGEIIRNFGLQLRNMEFTIKSDPKFPVQWIWLNHLPIVGKDSHKLKVQESSLFINMKKEPNIRNLDSVHSLIHRILEGKERRNIYSDELFNKIIRDMINDVIVEEKTEAIKFFESQPKFGSKFNFSESTYIPYLLLNFDLTKSNFKLSWDTIEMYANPNTKPTREEFSTSGYPWVIDTSNRFRDVLIDMFNKRLEGSVDLSKASFLWPDNNKIYFTIADVNPDTNKARIIIFRSVTEEELVADSEIQTYQFVDIRRRLDLLLSLPPERFNFKNIIERMNATDIQLVVDKLENL